MPIVLPPIFERQIQIGNTTIPLGFLFLFALCFAVVMILNMIYLRRYRRIMTYLQRNHADLHEQVCRKPEIGPLYSKTYNPSKPLIALAKRSPSTGDPKLDQMLSDFVQFDRSFVRLSSAIIVVMVIGFFAAGLILTT